MSVKVDMNHPISGYLLVTENKMPLGHIILLELADNGHVTMLRQTAHNLEPVTIEGDHFEIWVSADCPAELYEKFKLEYQPLRRVGGPG